MRLNIINAFFKRNKRGKNIESITYGQAKRILSRNEKSILIDVRSAQEYNEGHLKNAINIPLYELDKRADRELNDKNTIIILYCQTGNRSMKALELLRNKQYKNLYNIEGGLDEI